MPAKRPYIRQTHLRKTKSGSRPVRTHLVGARAVMQVSSSETLPLIDWADRSQPYLLYKKHKDLPWKTDEQYFKTIPDLLASVKSDPEFQRGLWYYNIYENAHQPHSRYIPGYGHSVRAYTYRKVGRVYARS